MSETGSKKYLKVWGSGLLIGLMGIVPAFADYTVIGTTAISRITISGRTWAGTGLISQFVVQSSTISGQVFCGPSDLPDTKAWHYTLIDLPSEPNGFGDFRINENLSVSVTTDNGPVNKWVNRSAGICSNSFNDAYREASELSISFPITLSFYITRRPIDNMITFPSMPLGGYIRSFRSYGSPPGPSRGIYTVPFQLQGGTIQLPSTCQVNPTALTLDHGTLPTDGVSHRTSAPITYTCDSPVKATFSLSYEADGNGALPLKDTAGKTGAVSKLTITDPETGASGRSIKAAIGTSKTFTVSSELSNITGNGQLSGSAWLIALQD
ncbi:hypothetical protein [Serratia fonticola]|uniref:hypothetical protein n=1 Tax=Serratia fonticola TaxID=47917 RepID=UPI0021771D79|nr:hypothetical protein [Serratia fonticola]CAI1567580.1 Uncharacterised protein [Serratia fonticola]CAI1762402.1 Uncharacterised protein [Serratia fonticola]CAI1768191.1 Uncharacterised protein [Serratia fonticola]